MKLAEQDRKMIKAGILDILKSYIRLSEYKVFFFGSRVNGTAGERSDIDVGIIGEKIDISKLLEIQEKLKDLKTPYTVNLIDFSNVSDSFKETAMKNVEYFG
ncbi:MAG: nucleotidyltransferase domain-containing protein [bacterium]